jgi:hypothetical protein
MEYEGLALPIRTIIIEAILVIVIGVVSNKIEKTFNLWAGILFSCSVVYVFLVVIRGLY